MKINCEKCGKEIEVRCMCQECTERTDHPENFCPLCGIKHVGYACCMTCGTEYCETKKLWYYYEKDAQGKNSGNPILGHDPICAKIKASGNSHW